MPSKGDDEIWVPVTINLPLGITNGFNPTECAPLQLLFGPFTIILLAQMSNTMLLSVVPYLVRDVANGNERDAAVIFGLLQSTLWTSQTVLAPVLGYASDRLGRKPVILLSLIVSGIGNLALSASLSSTHMMISRIISGLGFQITLFRAYFADTSVKKEKAGKFGLIGVVQQFALFAGPAIGGFVGDWLGDRSATASSGFLFLCAALLALLWRPDETKAEANDKGMDTAMEDGQKDSTHKRVGGIEMVKIDLSGQRGCEPDGRVGVNGGVNGGDASCMGSLADNAVCRRLIKAWRFARWLGGYDLYPLLSLNFFFRFSFAAYKSVFAFFCMAMLKWEKKQVGMILSAMGLGGMFVQGVLVRVTVRSLGEERTLFVAMAAESIGFIVLSYAHGLASLIPALSLIAIGYGLAVPCLTTLFANVPVEQGIMQGIAGFVDRFGQAFGPILGGLIYRQLGAANLMLCTGLALAGISSVCLMFIGDGCAAWMREVCCYHSAQGYQTVEMADQPLDEDEEEMAELEPSDENGSPKDGPKDGSKGKTPLRDPNAQNGAQNVGPTPSTENLCGTAVFAAPKLATMPGQGLSLYK
jgi:MFS family permease